MLFGFIKTSCHACAFVHEHGVITLTPFAVLPLLSTRFAACTGGILALDPCLIYDMFRQTKEWRQAAEPA